MITHIVMMKLKDPADAPDVAARLRALPAQIPEIRSYEVGIDELQGPRAWNVALVSRFDSFATLQSYIQHPAHQEVVAHLDQVCESRASVDFSPPE
jgi:hypothetical protein